MNGSLPNSNENPSEVLPPGAGQPAGDTAAIQANEGARETVFLGASSAAGEHAPVNATVDLPAQTPGTAPTVDFSPPASGARVGRVLPKEIATLSF